MNFLHPNEIKIPSGYEVRTDPGGRHYVNMFTGVRWFSAKDAQGKVYFYEENGNESCWRLPSVGQSIQDTSASNTNSASSLTRSERIKRPLTGSTKRIADNYLSVKEEEPQEDLSPPSKAKTEAAQAPIEGRRKKSSQNKGILPVSTPNFRIGGVSIVVVKQGPLHRTKLVENGRRHRKNWSSAHTVLTDTFLLFFKDQVRAHNY